MPVADRVIVELQAKVEQYKRDTAAARVQFEGDMQKTQVAAAKAEIASTKSFVNIAGSVGKVAGAARLASAAIGGPLVGGLAIAALGFATTTLTADKLGKALDELEDALKKYEALGDDIIDLEDRKKDATEELTLLIQDQTGVLGDQQQAAIDAKTAEISAIDERIVKNKELLALYEVMAELQLAQAQAAARNVNNTAFSFGEGRESGATREIIIDTANEVARERGVANVNRGDEEVVKRVNAELERRALLVQKDIAAKRIVSKSEEKLLADYLKRTETAIQLAEAEQRIADIKRATDDVPDEVDKPKRVRKVRPERDAELEAAKRVLDALEEAARTEEESIEALKQKRLDAIDTVLEAELKAAGTNASAIEEAQGRAASARVAAESEAQEAIQKLRDKDIEGSRRLLADLEKRSRSEIEAANATLDARIEAIEKIRAAELDAAQGNATAIEEANARANESRLSAQSEYSEAVEKIAQKEQALLIQTQDLRDELHGRTMAIIDREWDRRRERILENIQDETRRAEALAALDDARAQYESERDKNVLKGENPFERQTGAESEVERIREIETAKLKELEDWYAVNLEREAEYLARKRELNEQADAAAQKTRRAELAQTLGTASNGFATLARLAAEYAGEQSSIARAAVAISKGLAVAQAIINIQLALSEALKLPYPANLGAYAQVFSLGVGIISTLAGSGYAEGGEIGRREGVITGPGTGTSDSIPILASNGEFITRERVTRRNRPLLTALNNEETITPERFAALTGQPIRRFMSGGIVGGSPAIPRFMNGGLVGGFSLPRLSVPSASAPSVNVAAPNVSVNPQIGIDNYTFIDSAELLEAALQTSRGRNVFLRFMSDNRGSVAASSQR